MVKRTVVNIKSQFLYFSGTTRCICLSGINLRSNFEVGRTSYNLNMVTQIFTYIYFSFSYPYIYFSVGLSLHSFLQHFERTPLHHRRLKILNRPTVDLYHCNKIFLLDSSDFCCFRLRADWKKSTYWNTNGRSEFNCWFYDDILGPEHLSFLVLVIFSDENRMCGRSDLGPKIQWITTLHVVSPTFLFRFGEDKYKVNGTDDAKSVWICS